MIAVQPSPSVDIKTTIHTFHVMGQFDDSPCDTSVAAICKSLGLRTHAVQCDRSEQYIARSETKRLCSDLNDYEVRRRIPKARDESACALVVADADVPCGRGGKASNHTGNRDQRSFPKARDESGCALVVTDADVLCGRGGKANNHIGNREFRRVVDLHRQEYFVARKPRKTEISRAIVDFIRERGGRFLKQENSTGAWFDIGDSKAMEKASQALREGAAQKFRAILSSNMAASAAPVGTGAEKRCISPENVPAKRRRV